VGEVRAPVRNPLVNVCRRLLTAAVLVPPLRVLRRILQLLDALEVGLVSFIRAATASASTLWRYFGQKMTMAFIFIYLDVFNEASLISLGVDAPVCIADGLNPLTISHTAKPISWRANGSSKTT